MEIRPLESVSDYALCCAWQRAFVDYGMSVTNENLLAMFRRRGYDATVSFGAFTKDDEFVSMTLNGVGNFDGMLSGYDTSTGTAVEYRKQGLAGQIFERTLAALRERGVKQYVLEVLKENEAAKSLYLRMGLTVSREFFYFRRPVEATLSQKDDATRFETIRIDLPALEQIQPMWDFLPSWQNSYESMQRAVDTLTVLGVRHDSELVGYAILDPNTGDISQLAVKATLRRRGIATQLLAEVLKITQTSHVKVVNVPTDAVAMLEFLKKSGFDNSGGQYEMRMPL